MDLQSLIPTAACLTIICTLAACQAQPVRQPTYSISVSGAGNQVISTSTGPETLFEVKSETGLGSADVEQTAGEPPARLLTRLHLQGMEEFDFEYDDVVVIVSVSSHGDQTVSERARMAGSEETPIASDSPYWMPVRIVKSPSSSGQNPTGYFEVQAPQEFIQGKHKAFAMRWIDFYR
jgi:hypothetical protein